MKQHPSRYDPVVARICSVIILGTLLVTASLSVLLVRTYIVEQTNGTLVTLFVSCLVFLYVALTYLLLRRHLYKTVSYLILALYASMAVSIVWIWGVNTPIGPLVFALVIIIAAILLTSRHALIVAVASSLVLAIVQGLGVIKWHIPDTAWASNKSSFGDVVAYSTVFMLIALISWLYNREMERLLAQASQAEAALMKQKATLKLRVEERTKELRQLQLEEMRHMYNFAELGQLGATLLHDLADHLTSLTLAIEGIEKQKSSKSIANARQATHYLEDLVHETRERLNGETKKQAFNMIRLINDTIDFLHKKSEKAGVTIDWQPQDSFLRYVGDPMSLSQIVGVVISNAIDSYSHNEPYSPTIDRRVWISVAQDNAYVVIRVKDQGKGLTADERNDLFKPHHSSKKSGLGLGLYIAKQIVELQFSGTITLDDRMDRTEFIIRLPKSGELEQ